MKPEIKVTRENVALFEQAADLLATHLDELAQKTKRYPVECEFGDYRFVFASRADIEELIAALRAGTRAFHQAA